MSETQLISPMEEAEARTCVKDIKEHIKVSDEQHQLARQKAYVLWERQGWKALGYHSFLECAKAEFGSSFQHVYRLKSVEETQRQLTSISPTGENFQLPETHNRILNALPTVETKYTALKKAEALAKAEGMDAVKERHIKSGVRATAMEMRVSNTPLLSHLVTNGQMSVETADEIGTKLDRLKPATKGYIFQLIAKSGGISDPAVVEFIGRHYERTDDKVSQLVIEVLDRTECLGGIELRRANMSNALRELEEARTVVESDETHTQDDYGPVHLTLLERNADGSRRELETMMSKSWFEIMRPVFREWAGIPAD